jgi:putative glycerol-1-phosphate prenyltransferase
MGILKQILDQPGKKLGILVDPEKTNTADQIRLFTEKVNLLKPAFILVGGSTVSKREMDNCIQNLKQYTTSKLVIFPGSHQQVNEHADGILFLSLISGRNPDYLIGHQVESACLVRELKLEAIPTGYILIEGGAVSAVSYISQTSPIPADQYSIAIKTAIAGELLGLQSIFLDAGSGAKHSVSPEMIRQVKKNITVPLIVGGGIKSISGIESCFDAGADLVVIGNKIEDDIDFLLDLVNLYGEKTN